MSLGRLFWKVMALSFLIFWVLDLLTSGILIWSRLSSLEGNTSVRSFFMAPKLSSLVVFVQNQTIYLVPFLFLLIPLVVGRISKEKPRAEFYLLSAVLVAAFAADRLNLGIASNVANLVAIAEGFPVPASGNLYFLLWGVFDVGWVTSVVLYLFIKRERT